MAKPKPRVTSYLAELRKTKQLRAAEVRRHLRPFLGEVSRSNFTRWEQGSRGAPMAFLSALADIYDVAFGDLVKEVFGLRKGRNYSSDPAVRSGADSTLSPEKAEHLPVGQQEWSMPSKFHRWICDAIQDLSEDEAERLFDDVVRPLMKARKRRDLPPEEKPQEGR